MCQFHTFCGKIAKNTVDALSSQCPSGKILDPPLHLCNIFSMFHLFPMKVSLCGHSTCKNNSNFLSAKKISEQISIHSPADYSSSFFVSQITRFYLVRIRMHQTMDLPAGTRRTMTARRSLTISSWRCRWEP